MESRYVGGMDVCDKLLWVNDYGIRFKDIRLLSVFNFDNVRKNLNVFIYRFVDI